MGCLSLLYVKLERKCCHEVCIAANLPEPLRRGLSGVHCHGSMHAQALAVSHAAGSQCARPAVHAPSGKHEVCGCTHGCSVGCAQKIYKEGGMSALFKGNFATMVKVAPQTAIQFAVSLLQI